MRRLVFAVLLLAPLPALAQQKERLYLPVDPDAESSFQRLDELGARGQWDRVVLGLDKLLKDGGDRLLSTAKGFRSVRDEARRRLRALEGDGRRAYDLLHADAARKLYLGATRSAEVGPLLEILARHPASRSARSARRLLASRLVERGDPAAALPHITSLLSERLDEDERERLERVRVLALALSGRRGEAVNALDALTATKAEQIALRSRIDSLQAPPTLAPPDPKALAWSQEVFGYYEITVQATRPWSLPKADVATAYVHDGSHATAVDIESGKLRWRTPLRNQDAFERPKGLCPLALAPGVVLCALPEGLGLVALDRRSGRRLWARPLSALKSDAGIDFPAHLASSAPPLIAGGIAGVVLVTDHQDQEVHVLGVNLHTGDLAWTVFVASESGGAVPVPALAHGGDRFYVVTGHGAAAAIDPSGEVLWLTQYTSKRDKAAQRGRGGIRRPFRVPRQGRPPARGDPALSAKAPGLLVNQGMVWAAPADADGMLILDAEGGEIRAQLLQTQAPRLLAVRETGVLVLTQPGHLIQVTRADQTRLGVVGGTLDASTALVGDMLYAAAGGAVLAVDLTNGKVDVATSWKHSRGPGHLVASSGRLLVAAPRGLYAFGTTPAPAEDLPADALVASLSDRSFAVREAASSQLFAEREGARSRLSAAAEHRDPEVSLRALRLLGELDRVSRLERWTPLVKADWKQKVPDLLNRLTHPNPVVRLESLEAMGAIQNDPAVEILLKDLLPDGNEQIAFTAAAALLDRGNRDGIKHLAKGLEQGDPNARHRAAELFANKGEPEDLAILTEALDDSLGSVRAIVARGVLRLYSKAENGDDALNRVLELTEKDESSAVRLAVLKACIKYKVQAEKAWTVFTKAATDPNAQIRAEAIRLVAGLDSAEAYRVLGLALGDPIRETARMAAKKLYSVASKKDKVLQISAEGLEAGAKQQDEHQRNYVSQIALRYLDAGGLLSVPTLTRFAADPNAQIRGYTFGGRGWGSMLAKRVAENPCDAAAMTALANLTLEKDDDLRRQGYTALGGALHAPGRGALIAQGLADEKESIRVECGQLLLPTGPGDVLLNPATVHAVLKVSLRSTREHGREAAKKLLDRTPADLLFPGLIPLLGGTEADLREATAARLAGASEGTLSFAPGGDLTAFQRQAARWWWIRSHPGQSPEQLLLDLRDENPTTRWRAAQAAAELPLPSVRNALVASLNDKDPPWVLTEKLKALVRITGEEHGFRAKLSPAGLARCAQRFKTWLSRRIAAEARGER